MQLHYEVNVRVFFKSTQRSPMFGRFVKLTDHEEKLKKGWVRFVSQAKSEEFRVARHVMYTKLFFVNDILSVHESTD